MRVGVLWGTAEQPSPAMAALVVALAFAVWATAASAVLLAWLGAGLACRPPG